MFITRTALFTDLTFGKGESQRENHFLFLDSLMSTTLLIYLLYSLLLKQKEVMLQQLAKTKSKIVIRHPPMIGTHFWKIKRYFLSFGIKKIGFWMQNDQKLRQIRITLFKMVTFPSLLSQQHLSMALCYVQFPCVLLGGNLIFLHRMKAHFNRF